MNFRDSLFLFTRFLVMLKEIRNNSEDLLVFMDRIVQNPDAINNAWEFLKENVLNVQVNEARLQNVSGFNPSIELKEQLLLIFTNQFTEEGIENEIAPLLENWPADKKISCMAKIEAALDKNRQWQKRCVDAFLSPTPPPLEPPQFPWKLNLNSADNSKTFLNLKSNKIKFQHILPFHNLLGKPLFNIRVVVSQYYRRTQ